MSFHVIPGYISPLKWSSSLSSSKLPRCRCRGKVNPLLKFFLFGFLRALPKTGSGENQPHNHQLSTKSWSVGCHDERLVSWRFALANHLEHQLLVPRHVQLEPQERVFGSFASSGGHCIHAIIAVGGQAEHITIGNGSYISVLRYAGASKCYIYLLCILTCHAGLFTVVVSHTVESRGRDTDRRPQLVA